MEYPNITQDKLIILHIIDKLNKSITNLQMVDLILETTGIDYFSLQELLLDLQDKQLILLIVKNDTRYYKITEDGQTLIASLTDLIPKFILNRVDSKIRSVQKNIEKKEIIWADYTFLDENNFVVECKISENDICMIKLNLNVPTKQEAMSICNRWYENPSKCYLEILNIFSERK